MPPFPQPLLLPLFALLSLSSANPSSHLPHLHLRTTARTTARAPPFTHNRPSHLFVLQAACQSEQCHHKALHFLQNNHCQHLMLFDHLRMIKAKCSPKALNNARRSRRFIAIHRDEVIRLAAPLHHHALSPAPLRMSTTLRPPHERSFQKISALSFYPNRTAAVAHDGTIVDLSAQKAARRCSKRGGDGVTVYVIDTGCRSSHHQLRGRVRTMPAPGSAYMSGEDDHGHGTHVAATIGGRDFGIAPRASLVCIKALSERNEGSAHDVVAGVQLAMRLHKAQHGPGVISISLGGRAGRRKTALDAAVDAASRAGLSFVVAAGNAGADACAFTPGRARMAITVAAVDDKGKVAAFSNSGGCVSVGAPGVRVWSAVADDDDAYGVSSGTSMAAPFVSGLVALLVGDNGRARTRTVRKWLREIGLGGGEHVPVVSAREFCAWRRFQAA